MSERPTPEELIEEYNKHQEQQNDLIREESLSEWTRQATEVNAGITTQEPAESVIDVAHAEALEIDKIAKELTTRGIFTSENEAANAVIKWQLGTKEYAKLKEELSELGLDLPMGGIEFMGMFLGEKPAVYLPERMRVKNEKDDSEFLKMCEVLRKHGVKKEGDYFYNPDLISKLIIDNYTIFQRFGLSKPEEVIAYLNKTENHMLTGLVVGIPLEAAQDFQKRTKFNFFKKPRPTESEGAYGIYWTNSNPTASTKLRTEQIKVAYEISGIKSI